MELHHSKGKSCSRYAKHYEILYTCRKLAAITAETRFYDQLCPTSRSCCFSGRLVGSAAALPHLQRYPGRQVVLSRESFEAREPVHMFQFSTQSLATLALMYAGLRVSAFVSCVPVWLNFDYRVCGYPAHEV